MYAIINYPNQSTLFSTSGCFDNSLPVYMYNTGVLDRFITDIKDFKGDFMKYTVI